METTQDEEQEERQEREDQTAGAPPPVPRPVTQAARRRAWAESGVRTWWLAALGVLAVAVYVGADQYAQTRRDQALFDVGVPTTTRIYQIQTSTAVVPAGVGRDSFSVEPDEHPKVFLEFDALKNPDGSKRRTSGFLAFQKGPIHPNDRLPIRYDPANPDRWTDRVDPISYGRELFLPLLLLPSAALLIALALWQRRRVLRLWADGERREAVVAGVGQSAIAPLSRLVRCTLLHGRDKRVISVLIPTRVAQFHPGDVLWIITAPNDVTRWLPARAYE